MPLKLHAIEDWSRKRLVSELGSARFDFDPPMNLGSRSTYLILSSPLSSVRIACFLPFLGPMMQTERSTLTRMAYYEYELRSEVAAAYFEVVAYGASSKTTSETKPKHTCVLFVAPTEEG